MKFLMTQAVCRKGLDILADKAIYYVADNGNPNEYLDEMQDVDALIVRIGSCDANVIQSSPNLKVIGRTGVGYDSIDADAATKAGIPIVITPGANSRSVAEHAVGLMFAVAKNIVESHNETTKGNFTTIRGAGKCFELFRKKAAFIGLGAIGRETQRICKAIGMETLGYDPFLDKKTIEELGCRYFLDYEKMIQNADVVSVHVPLTEETRGMISMKQLKMMKRTAIIINCSRGGIIDEIDLADALNNDVIAGAGIDVFEEEPPLEDHFFMRTKNMVLTPHSAAQTREAVINMAQMCVKGCLAVINGEKWPYVANPKVYEHPRWRDSHTY